MIGAGVQARTQLEALQTVLPGLRRVYVYDVRVGTARDFALEMSDKFHLEVQAVDTPREAVEGADVIVTATTADKPIVKNAWVKPGSFFAHVGSYQEEEEAVVSHSDMIVVDDWEAVLHRRTPILAKMVLSGQLQQEEIHANLGEIILGQKPGRRTDRERIFYSPIGLGAEDVAVGREVYRLAAKRGLGRRLPLF